MNLRFYYNAITTYFHMLELILGGDKTATKFTSLRAH